MTPKQILCTSQSSTYIHLPMDEPSSSTTTTTTTTTSSSSPTSSISSTTHLTSSRAIDRHNPIIRDEKRVLKPFITPPCSNSQHPISPKPHKHHHYKTILSSGNNNNKTNKGSSGNKSKIGEQKRKGHGGWGCTKPSAFISPPTSSRYLLSDKALLNVLNDFDPILTLVQKEKSKAIERDEPSSSSSSASKVVQPPSSSRSVDQVVVLRVSLHCKGCERKMRKHLSRMEGVTSFNIDFAAKKLTVVGDVTPLSVLASVSKVKNATLLTPTTISSSSAPIPPPRPPPPPPGASSNYMAEIEKYQEIVV